MVDAPLTRTVLDYTEALTDLVPRIETVEDWAPLAQFVAVDDFERVGTFMERQDWAEYTAMLTQWASSVEKFETTARRITEGPDVVFFEIEERHHRDGGVLIVNSMTVFAFDADGKIQHLDVYLQQPR